MPQPNCLKLTRAINVTDRLFGILFKIQIKKNTALRFQSLLIVQIANSQSFGMSVEESKHKVTQSTGLRDLQMYDWHGLG